MHSKIPSIVLIKKVTKYLAIFLLIILPVLFVLMPLHQRHDAKYYYDIVRNQENYVEGTVLTEQEKALLLKCESQNECLRLFFDEYTMKHGVEKAFSLLVLFQKEYPERSRGCHYVAHGIGHASLRLNANDLAKAFSIMDMGYYKNIATCGVGYFHGVVEEFAKDIKDKTVLIEKLKNVCEGQRGSCHHGIGHAASIQLDDSIPDALYVCDHVTDNAERRFECHTGVFMQQSSIASVTVEKGLMNFIMCDAQEAQYRPACYLEQSSMFEWFSDNNENYVRNIGFCKQIDEPLYRMACIKLFAIRSVRIAKFENVGKMCRNTSSSQESIMCTAVTASKMAKSIDYKNLNMNYDKIVWDVCATMLNPLDKMKCYDLAINRPGQLFYTSAADILPVQFSRKMYGDVDTLFEK